MTDRIGGFNPAGFIPPATSNAARNAPVDAGASSPAHLPGALPATQLASVSEQTISAAQAALSEMAAPLSADSAAVHPADRHAPFNCDPRVATLTASVISQQGASVPGNMAQFCGTMTHALLGCCSALSALVAG